MGVSFRHFGHHKILKASGQIRKGKIAHCALDRSALIVVGSPIRLTVCGRKSFAVLSIGKVS